MDLPGSEEPLTQRLVLLVGRKPHFFSVSCLSILTTWQSLPSGEVTQENKLEASLSFCDHFSEMTLSFHNIPLFTQISPIL
jgi:hypothetical protein